MVHAPAIASDVGIGTVNAKVSALRFLRLLFLYGLLGGLLRSVFWGLFHSLLCVFLGRLFRSRFLCSFLGSGFLNGSLCGWGGLCYLLLGLFGGSPLFLWSNEEGGRGRLSNVGKVA